MKKAIVGIAAVLALTTTASARDEKGAKKVARNTPATTASARTTHDVTKIVGKSGNVQVVQADTGSSKMKPVDVNASHAERWLVEREGYRDGGY